MKHCYFVVRGIEVLGSNPDFNVACQIAREHGSLNNEVVIYSKGVKPDSEGVSRVYNHCVAVCNGDNMIMVNHNK